MRYSASKLFEQRLLEGAFGQSVWICQEVDFSDEPQNLRECIQRLGGARRGKSAKQPDYRQPLLRAAHGNTVLPPNSAMNSRRLITHLVGPGEQRRRDFDAEGFRGSQIGDEFELRR